MIAELETWRVSPSLPEYEVSSLGRVRRIPYQAPMPAGGMRWYGGQAHHGQLDKTGKRGLRKNFVFRGKCYIVHVLVCEAFSGAKPFPGAVVMHLNENALDNRAGNLAWGTQKENMNAPGFLDYARRAAPAKFAGMSPN